MTQDTLSHIYLTQLETYITHTPQLPISHRYISSNPSSDHITQSQLPIHSHHIQTGHPTPYDKEDLRPWTPTRTTEDGQRGDGYTGSYLF